MVLATVLELSFASLELQRLCNRQGAMGRRLGPAKAAALAQRLQELDAVHQLADLELFPYLTVQGGATAKQAIVKGPSAIGLRLAAASGQTVDGTAAWREWTAAVIVEVIVSDG